VRPELVLIAEQEKLTVGFIFTIPIASVAARAAIDTVIVKPWPCCRNALTPD
jgi:hypothetical protein